MNPPLSQISQGISQGTPHSEIILKDMQGWGLGVGGWD